MTDVAPQVDTRPEFLSVILTLDHSTAPREDGSLLQKFVGSTQDLTEAMLALFNYYEESHLLFAKSTVEMFQMAAQAEMPCFVYRTRENVQIVMSAETFQGLCASQGGSILAASAMIADVAGKSIVDAMREGGDAPVLYFLSFEQPSEAMSAAMAAQEA